MFPMWVYFGMAALIAATAFAIGQLAPGMGVPFVVLATTLWAAFAVSRQRKLDKRNG